jgi:hypothetical protein
MSHESGFRRGSRSFTQKGAPVPQRKPKGSRSFDQRMAKRFHEHEREVQGEAEEAPADTDEKT